MSSVNKVIIVGNLGRDPEMRSFLSGDRVANVTVATTDKWKDKQTGEMREATEWHRIVFNGRLAEIAGEYLRKGSQVYVEGSLRTRKWADQAGGEKYTTEIRADRMQMLGGKPQGGGRGGDGYDDGDGYDQPTQRQQRQAAPQGRGAPQQRQAPQRGQQQRAAGGGSSGFDDFGDDMDADIPFVSSAFAHDDVTAVRRHRWDTR